jgi:protein-tyrosine phosphatase
MLNYFLPKLFRSKKRAAVMVVCMENLCRSPLASELLNVMFTMHGMSDRFKAESAGISVGMPGKKPDPRVVRMMQERGLGVPKSRSRQLEHKMVSNCVLIVAVDRQVQQLLSDRLGVDAPLLMEFANLSSRHQSLDVPDPYYTNQQGFERVYELIEEAALGVAEHLKQRS